MSNTQNLIDKLTNAISFSFKEDTTAPNLTISKLKNEYYCSVVRYKNAFAKGKVVVCSARCPSLDEALDMVANSFLKIVSVKKDPVQELNDMVNQNTTKVVK